MNMTPELLLGLVAHPKQIYIQKYFEGQEGGALYNLYLERDIAGTF